MNNNGNLLRRKLNNLSLSQQLKLTLITGFVIVAMLGAIALVFISKSVEDRVFEQHLQSIIKQYQSLPADKQASYQSINLTIYQDLAAVPNQYQHVIEKLTPGLHDIEFALHEEFHVAIVPIDGKVLYFFYDVYDLEISEESELIIVEVTLALFLLLLFVVLYFFQSSINKAMLPMFTLIAQIKNANGTLVKNFTNPGLSENDQEVGLLFRTLNDYSDRLHKFVEREREFTGFASHELRTPVTIIKGATELLELQQSQHSSKQIQRIKRATQEMEDMINVLLSLARERKETNIILAPMQQLFGNLLNTYQPRANKHNKQFNCFGSLNADINVPNTHFNIVIENLLINAIKYSDGNNIDIQLSENSISIGNNTGGQHQHTQGYGLGKIIIQRICEQQNWTFTHSESEKRLVATIEFSQ